ncbi:MAG TPA: hypothetical protein VGD76_21305 [Ramlibacter sp.]
MRRTPLVLAAASAALLAACAGMGGGSTNPMSFFVTSSNPGNGADFGGLAGADRHCQALASAAGAGGKTWRAYLSTTGAGGVNARDRIGRGPWVNAKGVVIAANVDQLHGTNQITKATALNERGEVVMGRGDAVNMHDILTGSTPDGRATVGGSADTTCGNWTKSGDGSAIVGHHDRIGLNEEPPAKSWNSSHGSRGCSQDQLKASGGAGLFYCFAAN